MVVNSCDEIFSLCLHKIFFRAVRGDERTISVIVGVSAETKLSSEADVGQSKESTS